MTPLALALGRAQRRLLQRLNALDEKLDGDADDVTWDRYTTTLTALVTVITEPERSGRPISARELAARFGVSDRTIRRRQKAAR